MANPQVTTFRGYRCTTLILGGDVTGLTAARSLGRRGVPVYIVVGAANDLAARSRYVRTFVSGPPDSDGFVDELLRRFGGSPARPVLLVASDLGRPVYDRLGYLPLLRYTLWAGHRRP